MTDKLTRQDVRPLARYAAVILSSGDVLIFLLLVGLLVPAAGQIPDIWNGEWIAGAIALVYFLVLQVIMVPIIVWLYKF